MLERAWLFTLFLTTAFLRLDASLPELSALEPLEFDEASQRLIAKGDARLDLADTRVRADRITYYQAYGLADATGNVSVTHLGNRLLAERLSYEAETETFSVELMRTGQWPYHISGVSAGGTVEQTSVEGATLYYGEPGPFALSVAADSVFYAKDAPEPYVKMEGATFRVGQVPLFYLPAYTYYLESYPYYLELDGGYDDELGAHLQTTALFPLGSTMRLGANFDLYSERGVLIGPAAQYVYDSELQQIQGALSTGWIKDQADDATLGQDINNEQIDASRGFAEWRHKHHIGDRFTMTASATYWSDSEVTRDFREDYYNRNQSPDNFAEAAYAGDNFILSAFGRFRPNDFILSQERLPELRFDLLPVPILQTGAYQQASASFTELREQFDFSALPASRFELESQRYDLSYRIERPVHFKPWLTLTPLAGFRLTGYDQQEIQNDQSGTLLADGSVESDVYELGFDLDLRAYRSYDTRNATWAIDGLRHTIRPVLRYRYFSEPDDLSQIAAIDREVFNLDRPLLDLSDLRHIDQITEQHLTRIGLENLFQTRAENYGSRTLAALNFYQDILFDKETRYDGSDEETLEASWLELILQPAPWVKFELASRFRTESLTLDELRTRTSIRSGEIWEVSLSTDLLNKRIDQYRINFIHRLNERHAFLSDLFVDADSGEINRFSLGLRTRTGSTWQIFYMLTFRENAARESDVEFGVKLSLAPQEPGI